MTLCQPAALQKLLGFLQCSQLPGYQNDPDQNYYIYTEMGYQCYTDSYTFFLLVCVVPSILLWLVLLPGIPLFYLYKNRNNLEEDHHFRVSFGILLLGYKKEAYYWGFVDMSMKLALICVSQFLYMDTKTNIITSCLIIYIYYGLHRKIQPFTLAGPQKIELYSIYVYILTFFFWLYTQENSSEILTFFGEIAMIVINITFISTLVAHILITISSKIRNFTRKLLSWIKFKYKDGNNDDYSALREGGNNLLSVGSSRGEIVYHDIQR